MSLTHTTTWQYPLDNESQLYIRLDPHITLPNKKKKITWKSEVIDNEYLGKKICNCCTLKNMRPIPK